MNEAMRSVSRLRENKIFVSDVCELSSAADNVQQNAVLSEECCSLSCAGTERSVSSPPRPLCWLWLFKYWLPPALRGRPRGEPSPGGPVAALLGSCRRQCSGVSVRGAGESAVSVRGAERLGLLLPPRRLGPCVRLGSAPLSGS